MSSHLEHDWYPAPLPPSVDIGSGSWLYSSFSFLHDLSSGSVRIGANSGCYDGTFFDLGTNGSVEIGQYCSIVGAIISADCPVRIGDHALIAHEVIIADDPMALPPDRREQRDRRSSDRIDIGDNVWISAQSVILGPITIGDNAVIGARTVVAESVPANSTVVGNPARIIRRRT